jgi:hypothetical protein
VPPQVAITDITVFNHSLQDGQPAENVKAEGPVTAPTALTLSAQASVFSIEFAALHYTEPSLNRYAYQLQGFDRDWVETDAAHRSASYTNLNPGRIPSASRRPTIWACGTRTGHAGSHDHAAVLAALVVPFRPDRAGGQHAAAAYKTRISRLTRHQAELEQLVTARTAELEESNRKLAALSTTDGLTGVSNRRGFDLALEAEWRRAAAPARRWP